MLIPTGGKAKAPQAPQRMGTESSWIGTSGTSAAPALPPHSPLGLLTRGGAGAGPGAVQFACRHLFPPSCVLAGCASETKSAAGFPAASCRGTGEGRVLLPRAGVGTFRHQPRCKPGSALPALNKTFPTSVGGQSLPCNRERKKSKELLEKIPSIFKKIFSKSPCQAVSLNELHSCTHKDQDLQS